MANKLPLDSQWPNRAMKHIKFDVILDPDSSPDEVCKLGLLAESYGLHSVWTSNYPSSRDPFISLCPLALASSTIRLGTRTKDWQ